MGKSKSPGGMGAGGQGKAQIDSQVVEERGRVAASGSLLPQPRPGASLRRWQYLVVASFFPAGGYRVPGS